MKPVNFIQLWVIGGSGSTGSRRTSEIIDENGSKIGPELPWDFSSHCSTKINSTHAIITGGAETTYATQCFKIYIKMLEVTLSVSKSEINGFLEKNLDGAAPKVKQN